MLSRGPDTFLGVDCPFVVPCTSLQKYVFELVHTGIGKQQGGIIQRHNGGRADEFVAFGLKKGDKLLSDLLGGFHGKKYGLL